MTSFDVIYVTRSIRYGYLTIARIHNRKKSRGAGGGAFGWAVRVSNRIIL